MDVSKVFSSERGFSTYRLVVATGVHDRHLLIDNKRLYHLGGSLKDAGKRQPYTISVADVTAQIEQAIEGYIAGGTEYFGPSQTTHP